MYIAPNSTIYLMGGINWTPAYTDTVYFANKTVQLNYMRGKIKRKFESQSYQRHSKNVLRILASADSLYDCNYLMFQNRFRSGTLGDKWFYAFIIDIEYVNENTADIYYEIDVLQTWFWDLKLGMCFVEREIPRYDTLFGNLVPENLETGEYVIHNEEFFNLMNPTPDLENPNRINRDYTILITALTDPEGNYPEELEDMGANYLVNGLPTGVIFKTHKIRIEGGEIDRRSIDGFFRDINLYNTNGLIDNIVNIQVVPSFITENAQNEDNPYSAINPYANKVIGGYFMPTEFVENAVGSHYIPRNNKLYTYPYMQLVVSNHSGNVAEFKFENFSYNSNTNPWGDPITFQMSGCINGTPAVMLTPLKHRNVQADYDNSIVLSNFPTIPLINDTFKAYMAQNKASINTQVLANIVDGGFNVLSGIKGIRSGMGTAIAGAFTGNLGTMVGGKSSGEQGALSALKGGFDIYTAIKSGMATVEGHKAAPKTVANLTQTDALNIVINRCGFTIYSVGIKPEMARSIDNYFSAYGYAQNKIKKPDIMARTYWGYVKTIGCELIGSCPEGVKAEISAIFDSGIRFWNSNEIIGDYSLDNSRPRAESEGN